MSRRESRVSINVRQNDALVEFENFKKKFLLANKHITKLNSTLSVRIEELNAQLSTLYVENLRLRASEISLAAQLKREREKSRKVMADAEDATLNLSKHLSNLRQTLNIQAVSPSSPTPSPPRARRPPANPNPSPNTLQGNRISRPPNVPGIYEDEEPCTTSSDEKPPTPVRRKTKPKPRLSASRLPLPARTSPPPDSLPALPTAPPRLDLIEALSGAARRKPSRRQSGLLNVNRRDTDSESLSTPRPASPAFGSPIRREAVFTEDDDEIVNVDVEVDAQIGREAEFDGIMRKEKRKGKGKERESDRDSGVESVRPRERERKRAGEENSLVEGDKLKLQDVTNSPRGHTVLPPIDNAERDRTTPEVGATGTTSRPFLGTSSSTPPLPPYLPTPRASSSPGSPTTTMAASESEGSVAPPGGRERRTRKSVNYAEPKLNTKMRKPDSQSGSSTNSTGTTAPRKRSSTSAVIATFTPVDDNENDADNDTEARSSLEGYSNINGLRIPPTATLSAASIPLPPSRPTSSASMASFAPAPSARSSLSSSSATTSVKRKKSRPYIVVDDDESDGAQADAEYGGGRLGLSGWVNVEGRRRSGVSRRGTGAMEVVMGRVEGDDERRHSMAV